MILLYRFIDSLHVSTSNIAMLRKLDKKFKLRKKVKKGQEKELMKHLINRHENNLKLYIEVMRGY